jgi:hypothetical protein
LFVESHYVPTRPKQFNAKITPVFQVWSEANRATIGTAASVVGNIANGLSADKIDMGNPPYVSLKRQHEHEYTVTASPDGELWLLVGTDSGFEGLTGIYYQRIVVTLKPVK